MTMVALPNLIDWPEAVSGGSPAFGSIVVDAAGEGMALVFAVPKTGSIKKIGWRTGNVTVGGKILVQLETLAGAAPAAPSGALVAAGATKTVTVANANDNLWFLTELTTPYSATKGEMLAAVIKADAGFAGYMNLSRWGLGGPLIPGGLPSLPYLLVNAGSWALVSTCADIAICYDDGLGGDEYPPFPGMVIPADTFTSNTGFDSGDDPDEVGNLFSLPFRARVCGLWFWGDLDADATLKLYGATTDTIAIDSDNRSGTGMGTHYYWFADGGIVLEADTQYRVTILPGASTITVNDIQVAAAAQLGHLPGGTACYWTQRTNAGAWTDTATRRCLSVGLLLDQIDVPILPAVANVWHDTGQYGYVGSLLTPAMVGSDIANCAAGNVKKDVVIDDVTGTYDPLAVAVFPNPDFVWHTQPDFGPDGNNYDPAMVGSDIPNCEAGIIKDGATIDDVTGTYSPGGTYTEGQLAQLATDQAEVNTHLADIWNGETVLTGADPGTKHASDIPNCVTGVIKDGESVDDVNGTYSPGGTFAEGQADQHATDAAFLETNKDEIIVADTDILAEFGVTGTAAGGGSVIVIED